MGAQGVVLLDYQAGIGTGTSTGASDPATQGWAYSGSGSGFSDGFDAGTGVGTTYGGGWRTVDGTSGAQSVYTQDTSPIIGAITAADIWRMSWTVALDQDAVRTVGAAVTDYYNAPNQGRQNAILLYFDMDDVDSFRVVHRVNEFDEVLLDVSGTQYNTGVSLDNFGSYSITYNKAAGTALLDYGAGTATINPSSVDPNRSTIFMGSGSSGGQGSGVWNSMVIETNPARFVADLGVVVGAEPVIEAVVIHAWNIVNLGFLTSNLNANQGAVPLADDGGLVAVFAEELRDGDFGFWKVNEAA